MDAENTMDVINKKTNKEVLKKNTTIIVKIGKAVRISRTESEEIALGKFNTCKSMSSKKKTVTNQPNDFVGMCGIHVIISSLSYMGKEVVGSVCAHFLKRKGI